MFFPFPYVGAHYEEYCISHHIPLTGPWPMAPFGMGYGGPVPSYYAPPYGPHWPGYPSGMTPQLGYPSGYGVGFGGGYMPGMMGMGMGMGWGGGFTDSFGIQRGDWAGPYNGGTEGNIPN